MLQGNGRAKTPRSSTPLTKAGTGEEDARGELRLLKLSTAIPHPAHETHQEAITGKNTTCGILVWTEQRVHTTPICFHWQEEVAEHGVSICSLQDSLPRPHPV